MGGWRPAIAASIAAALLVGACSGNPASTPSSVPTQAPTPSPAVTSTAGPGIESPTPSDAGASPTGSSGSSIAPSGSPTAVSSAPTDGGPQESATPKPTKGPKPLPAYVTHGKRNGDPKVIALTMDADMYPFMYATKDSYKEYDPRVLQLLLDNKVHATIFANGLYVKAYPDIVKQLANSPGIEIANHSWDHGYWPGCQSQDPAAPPIFDAKGEITRAANIIDDTVGYKPDWFRFGGFCYGDASNLDLVKSLGEWPVGEDCFFGDSSGWSTAQQIASVQNTCTNGSIVVTHFDNTKYHPNVYEALKALIPWWKKNGWEVVNVTELMGQSPPEG